MQKMKQEQRKSEEILIPLQDQLAELEEKIAD